MATNETRVRSVSKTNNWRHLATLRERMSYLFDNPLMSDLIFICKDKQRFYAHKLIVSSGSKVFDDLINRSVTSLELWRVSTEDNKTTIEFNTCDVGHIKAVVKYLYTDQLEICDNSAADIIYWSKKFKVRSVVNQALEYIGSKLNSLNCLQWWHRLTTNKLAPEESDLINRCLYLIAINAKNRFSETLFTELSIDQFTALFSRNDLNINEFDLFKAAINWAEIKCKRMGQDSGADHNLRQTLGSAFDLIRFPIMSGYEFGLIITQYRNIFTREEVNSLIAYINSGVVIGNRLPFESKPRIPICIDQNSHTEPYYGHWRQPVCAVNHYNECQHCLNQQSLCQPSRTPLGYPQLYGTSFVSLSPPYTPSPQPMLAMTTSVSPPCPLEVRSSTLVRFPPNYRSNNSFANFQNNFETQPKRRTYASVVITDPKTGRNLDLKKLAENGFKRPNKRLSPQSIISITEVEDHDIPEKTTSESKQNSVICLSNGGSSEYEMCLSETYVSDEDMDDNSESKTASISSK